MARVTFLHHVLQRKESRMFWDKRIGFKQLTWLWVRETCICCRLWFHPWLQTGGKSPFWFHKTGATFAKSEDGFCAVSPEIPEALKLKKVSQHDLQIVRINGSHHQQLQCSMLIVTEARHVHIRRRKDTSGGFCVFFCDCLLQLYAYP